MSSRVRGDQRPFPGEFGVASPDRHEGPHSRPLHGPHGLIFLKSAFAARPDLFTVAKSGFRHEALRCLRWRNGTLRKSRLRHHLPLGAYYGSKYSLSRRWAMRGRGKHFLEVNNYLFPMLPEVSSAFPKARLVHIIRDPRTFLVSAMNRGWFLSVHGEWMGAPDLGEMTRTEWRALAPHQQLSWYWLRTNRSSSRPGPH